jgi:hypothetical protein
MIPIREGILSLNLEPAHASLSLTDAKRIASASATRELSGTASRAGAIMFGWTDIPNVHLPLRARGNEHMMCCVTRRSGEAWA